MKHHLLRWAACAALALCGFSSLSAQSVESIPYRAILSTRNEVPAVALDASGAGTVWLHIVRDASGEVTSASVDFSVNYKFPAPVTITAMHIHDGAAGTNGPVVIDSGVSRTEDTAAGALPTLQTQVSASTPAALAAVKGILADPSRYYLNMHTTVNPAGVIRGQLQRAEAAVRLAVLSPANEVPPVNSPASGRGTVVILRTTDAAGNTTSASVTFDVAYQGFPAETAISAMHLHLAPAGVNGPVTVDSTLATAITVPENGNGFLRFDSEVDLARAGALQTLDAFFWAPSQVYLNVHTRANPAGVIRGQLLATDAVSFQVNMSPANEVPALSLDVSAPAQVTMFTARGNDGAPVAGAILFDVNARFGNVPNTTFTAMHVHDGERGANGPVTLDSRFNSSPSLVKDGVGNIFRLNSLLPAAMASLASAVTNPEKHYANLHSQANPGGVVRAQLADANTARPELSAIITGASDPAITSIAPGGVASLYGANLAKASTNLSGVNGVQIPRSLNGTSVTVGGVAAPVLLVSPEQVNVQVPFNAPTGMQPVVVTNANGAGNTMMHMVAPVAPAILFDTVGGFVYKSTDLSLIRPENPAAVGDVIGILCTGLGVAAGAPTGQILPQDPLYPAVVQPTVTIAGRPAPVVGAAAAPGFVGLYIVATGIAPGTPSGNQPVVIRSGTVASNSVNIAIK